MQSHRLPYLSLAAFVTLSPFHSLVQAQECGHENSKFLADDGMTADQFGHSIAISGATAIIGSHLNDENGFNYGAVYLYDITSGTQFRKLTASPGAPAAFFGNAVAIKGVNALIGAPNDRIGITSTGSGYLFSTVTGAQLHRFDPSDGMSGDDFGSSVALSGNIIAIGAPNNGTDNLGATYLFDRITGSQLAKLVSPDALPGDGAGVSLAIDGTNLVIGAPQNIIDPPTTDGAVFMYDTSTMTQTRLLLGQEITTGEAFGAAVDIEGDYIVVGSPLDDERGIDTGSVYVFDTTTGDQLYKLYPTSSANINGAEFGTSVSIDGTRVLVGAPQMSSGAGHAFLFDLTTQGLEAEMRSSDPSINDSFGRSVAINNFGLLVGAPLDDDLGAQSGSVYRYDLHPTSCLADLNNDCVLNFFDISAFLTAFNANDLIVDFSGDGLLNFFDISAFLVAFNAGCP